MDIYAKLKELNITLPEAPPKGGVYLPAKEFGSGLVYISGCGPNSGTGNPAAGKLGQEYTTEEGYVLARSCMINVLAVLHAYVGDLNRVKQPVKVLTMVACTNDFYEQPAVANGGTGLLVDLWGKQLGAPSRSAIGVNVLPGNIPVETEALFELTL